MNQNASTIEELVARSVRRLGFIAEALQGMAPGAYLSAASVNGLGEIVGEVQAELEPLLKLPGSVLNHCCLDAEGGAR